MRPKLPTEIQILDVPLGTVSGSAAGFYAKSGATVTAQIEGDAVGLFRILRIETDDVIIDPDGPHGSVSVLQTAAEVDGPGPIAVELGQAFLVSVEFACPPDPDHAVFRATAVVRGPGLGPIGLPIFATARLGRLQLVNMVAPDVLPGGIEGFPFRIVSSLGHRAPVVVDCDVAFDPAFSAPQEAATVEPGEMADVTLSVTCAPGTPEGEKSAMFRLRAADGSQVFDSTEVRVRVTRTVRVFASLPDTFQMQQGDSARCALRIVVSGSPAQVDLTHGPLPPGLDVNPDRQTLPVSGTVFTGFDFDLSRNAPLGMLAPLKLFWTVREPEITGELAFAIEVVEDVARFSLDAPLSAFSHESDPKPMVCDMAVLVCRPDGRWTFQAHLENQETRADLSFLLEVKLDFRDSAGRQFGDTIDGALSASGEGPATKAGLRILGYPSGGTFIHHGVFGPFKEPAYFESVKATAARFRLLVATQEPDSPNIPDPPDKPDDDDKKKDPGQG